MSAAITLLARFLAAVVAVFTLLESSAEAQEKLKIGIITTLSGATGAVPGQQQRNGFELAVKMLGGKLGSREVEIVVADDELKPDVAVAKVKALVDRDKVAFVVGPIFSNILAAIVKPVTEANVFLIKRAFSLAFPAGGIGRNRRLAKDFEATIDSARAFLYAASVMLLVRRIARAS
jgi:ABC-type branched-subunit amino acid transport system substrate-binding protein